MTNSCFISSFLQALIFEQDFRQERRDREQAHSKFRETEDRYKHQLDALSAESLKIMEELNRQKKQCKDLESEYQARLSQLSYATGERDKKVAILEARNRELEVRGCCCFCCCCCLFVCVCMCVCVHACVGCTLDSSGTTNTHMHTYINQLSNSSFFY